MRAWRTWAVVSPMRREEEGSSFARWRWAARGTRTWSAWEGRTWEEGGSWAWRLGDVSRAVLRLGGSLATYHRRHREELETC